MGSLIIILIYPGLNRVLNIIQREQIHIKGLKAFLIQSRVEGFAEPILIRSARLDELVFDPPEGKKAIQSGLSEFGAIVGTKDEIDRPHMPGELWLGKVCRDMRTDFS